MMLLPARLPELAIQIADALDAAPLEGDPSRRQARKRLRHAVPPSPPSLFINGHPPAKPDTQLVPVHLRYPASRCVLIELLFRNFGSRIAFFSSCISIVTRRPTL